MVLMVLFVGGILGIGAAWCVYKIQTRTEHEQGSEIIIDHGKLRERMMRKGKLNLSDLKAALLQQGCTSVGQVVYAVLEKSGKITVIQKDAVNKNVVQKTEAPFQAPPLSQQNHSYSSSESSSSA